MHVIIARKSLAILHATNEDTVQSYSLYPLQHLSSSNMPKKPPGLLTAPVAAFVLFLCTDLIELLQTSLTPTLSEQLCSTYSFLHICKRPRLTSIMQIMRSLQIMLLVLIELLQLIDSPAQGGADETTGYDDLALLEVEDRSGVEAAEVLCVCL